MQVQLRKYEGPSYMDRPLLQNSTGSCKEKDNKNDKDGGNGSGNNVGGNDRCDSCAGQQ